MPVFHKLKIQIFMDVTHPRLLDAEGTGSTFPQNVCIYWPLDATAYHPARLESSSTLLSEPDNSYFP